MVFIMDSATHWGIHMTVKHLIKHLSAYPDDMVVKMCLDWGSGHTEHDIGGVIDAVEWEENNTNLWVYDEDIHGADRNESTGEEDQSTGMG